MRWNSLPAVLFPGHYNLDLFKLRVIRPLLGVSKVCVCSMVDLILYIRLDVLLILNSLLVTILKPSQTYGPPRSKK